MTEAAAEPAPLDEGTPVEPVATPAEPTEPAKPANAVEKALADPADAAPAPAKYPDDWREQMAGDDDKLKQQLDRYHSPADFAKAHRELQRKLSSGQFKATKPETEEEVAAWRKEMGIPEEPGGYDLNDLGNGLVVGEDDRPIIDTVLSAMHGADATEAQVKATVAAYYEAQEQALADQKEIDKKDMENAVDACRAEWGGEYRGNMNQLKGFLESAPDDLGTLLMTARLGDGKALMNSPEALQWLMGLSKQINPMGSVVPAGGDASGTVAGELKQIQDLQRENPDKYWGDKALQARERELLEWRSRQ